MNAKAAILKSHTDDGLDSARTERTVFTERTADLDPAPPSPSGPQVLATRNLTDEDLSVSGLPERPAPSGPDPAGGTDASTLEQVLEWTVPNIQTYMDDHPDDVEALKQLESQSDSPRKGVLEHEPPADESE